MVPGGPQDGTFWDVLGCCFGMAAGAQPGPILPRLPSTESPFCSLPHPPLRGREMPSAMNHPRNSSAPLCSPPRHFAIPPRADTPCVGSVPSLGPRRGRGDTSRPQNPSTAGPTSPNPAPHHPRGIAQPRRGCGVPVPTLVYLMIPWGFGDLGPGMRRSQWGRGRYLRVRSLFQAWQLMGSSRKLW